MVRFFLGCLMGNQIYNLIIKHGLAYPWGYVKTTCFFFDSMLRNPVSCTFSNRLSFYLNIHFSNKIDNCYERKKNDSFTILIHTIVITFFLLPQIGENLYL